MNSKYMQAFSAIAIVVAVIASIVPLIVSFNDDIIDIFKSKDEMEWVIGVMTVCAVVISGLAALWKISK